MATGLLIDESGFITNYIPVPVKAGDIIRPIVPAAEFCLAFYSKDVRDSLIYTYSYAPESNWATYVPECSDFEFSCLNREIKNDGFIRIVVRGIDRINKPPRFNELFHIGKAANNEFITPDWIIEEAERNAERVRSVQKPKDAVILLLADTHYATGGNWHFTWESLRLVSDKIHPDALIHLGDFTDGLMPSRHTFGIGAAIVSELNKICSQVFVCIGNHDKNRFRGNTDGISEKDCAELYLGREKSWYYTDLPGKKLRLLFLDSFLPDKKERYGFSKREVCWLKRVLCFTPKDYKIVIFSHVPPLPDIHVWSETIRNGEKMIRLLENYNRKHQGAVLGWIHGHNHADQIWTKRSFPIIGIGCSKLESFQEHKPEGSITWPRKKDSPSQELWDVLVVGVKDCRMDFIRFGAGEDRRTFNNHKSK